MRAEPTYIIQFVAKGYFLSIVCLYTGGVASFSRVEKERREQKAERRGRARAREGASGVVASSAFQNMRPYFTDIYCLRNDSFFFLFWSR